MERVAMYEKHVLSRILNVRSVISAFDFACSPDFAFSGEMHNFWEMIYVVEGTLGIAEDDRIYELCKGQVIFHKPMEFHRIWSAKKAPARYVVICFEAEGPALEKIHDGVFSIEPWYGNLIFDILNEIRTMLEKRGLPSTGQMIANKLEILILSLTGRLLPAKGIQKTRAAENYKLIINVLNKHVCENLSVSDIASLCGMSVSNLKKTFRKFSGEGIVNYLNRLKISFATELLNRGMTVSEVSERLSFSSQSYFTEVFKRMTGITPIAYKRGMPVAMLFSGQNTASTDDPSACPQGED